MILFIDNYDSFVYNLVHYVEDFGVATEVVRNDALTVEQALKTKPKAVILSPGPCTPNEAGICLDLLKQAPDTLPIFGVCLGHQAMGQAFGGGATDALFGAGSGNALTKLTKYTAGIFFALTLLISILFGKQVRTGGVDPRNLLTTEDKLSLVAPAPAPKTNAAAVSTNATSLLSTTNAVEKK